MTTLNLPGVIRPVQAEQVRRYTRALLESRLPKVTNLFDQVAVALGGNAETLSNVAPGPRQDGLPTLELPLLRDRMGDILKRDVRERMKTYGVRRDRADVMGVAAIVLLTLGRYLNVQRFLIPGVGIREGLLQEIARHERRIGKRRRNLSGGILRRGIHRRVLICETLGVGHLLQQSAEHRIDIGRTDRRARLGRRRHCTDCCDIHHERGPLRLRSHQSKGRTNCGKARNCCILGVRPPSSLAERARHLLPCPASSAARASRESRVFRPSDAAKTGTVLAITGAATKLCGCTSWD